MRCLLLLLVLLAPAITAAAPPIHADCNDTRQAKFQDWVEWRRKTFGSDRELLMDGFDPKPVKGLTGAALADAERMLRRGLEACDYWAAQAVGETGSRTLLPELQALLESRNISGTFPLISSQVQHFQTAVATAAAILDPHGDYVPHLLPLLASRDEYVRMTAARQSRHFPFTPELRAALLARVRGDDSDLVRMNAAKSLLDLGDVRPREPSDHPGLLQDIGGKWRGAKMVDAPPDADDRAGFARAADTIERLIRERAAAGKCSAPVRIPWTKLHVTQLNAKVAAITAEETESSCDNETAFVLFIESPDGFGKWMPAGGICKVDPTPLQLPLPAGQIVLEYRRADRVVRVEGTELRLPDANVAVLTRTSKGAEVRYKSKLPLRFPRDASPVDEVLRQTPALRPLVGR